MNSRSSNSDLVGAVILARSTSQRLPGKCLFQLGGYNTIDLGHIALSKLLPSHRIVVATSSECEDDSIYSYCISRGYQVYRGPRENVAQRFIEASLALGVDYAIRHNADRVFTDVHDIRAAITLALANRPDLVTNKRNNTKLAPGKTVECINVPTLSHVIKEFDSLQAEHVTPYFYENTHKFNIDYFETSYEHNPEDFQLALDTTDDLIGIQQTIRALAEYYPDPDVCRAELLDTEYTLRTESSPWDQDTSEGPMLIAEIGGDCEGSFDNALHLVNLAIESGVHAINLRLYSSNTRFRPPDSGRSNTDFALTQEQQKLIAERCQSAGKIYLIDARDLNMLKHLDKLLPQYMINVGDLPSPETIDFICNSSKPILLSTGSVKRSEVRATVNHLRKRNKVYNSSKRLCILQRTSMNPEHDTEANLSIMRNFATEYHCSVGYCDYSHGISRLLHAASAGAKVLQFSFTDSRTGTISGSDLSMLTKEDVHHLAAECCKISLVNGKAF